MRARRHCWSFIIILLFLFAAKAQGTELVLKFQDSAGAKVRVDKAELLLVAWGAADRLELDPKGDSLILNLDESWLRQRWPARFADMEGVYLLLRAEGYVAVRSWEFLWIGSHGIPYSPRVTESNIEFPHGERAVIREGDKIELTLTFRKRQARYLKILDDEGKAVSGVKVSSYLFWSASNHCGHLAGADPLGVAETASDGRIEIPDGDFEYAFEFEKPHYVLREPKNRSFPRRLITTLKADETIIRMHEMKKVPLKMRFTENGKPLAGKILLGTLADCPCGLCSGPVAGPLDIRTDSAGVLFIPDFYPEEWESIFIEDDKGNIDWKENPVKLPKTEMIEVNLSERD